MANSLNAVHAEGILGIDAIKNESSNGRESIFFTLGIGRSWKDKDGEWQNRTDWVPVVYSRSASDKLVSYLTKLTPVRIYGRLESYQKDVDGKPNTVVQIRAEDIEFMPRLNRDGNGSSGGSNNGGGNSKPARRRPPSRSRRRAPEPVEDDGEDDSLWAEDE